MLQADTKNTSKALSRRSAIEIVGLAAIAAGAAAAVMVPAKARLPVGECSYPELFEQFETIYARWLAQKTKDDAWSDEFDRRMAAAGIDPGQRRCRVIGDPGWDEYSETWDAVYRECPDPDPVDESGASIAWNEIGDVIYPLFNEIARHPALSLVDLAWKARAVALSDHTLWTDGASTDRVEAGALAVRSLVDDICRLAGVDVLPGCEIVPFDEIDEGD